MSCQVWGSAGSASWMQDMPGIGPAQFQANGPRRSAQRGPGWALLSRMKLPLPGDSPGRGFPGWPPSSASAKVADDRTMDRFVIGKGNLLIHQTCSQEHYFRTAAARLDSEELARRWLFPQARERQEIAAAGQREQAPLACGRGVWIPGACLGGNLGPGPAARKSSGTGAPDLAPRTSAPSRGSYRSTYGDRTALGSAGSAGPGSGLWRSTRARAATPAAGTGSCHARYAEVAQPPR